MYKVLIRVILLLIGAGIVAGGVLAAYYYHALSKPLIFKDEIFEVSRGETLNSITARLLEQGIITEPYTLKVNARLNNIGRQIKAGEYRFPDSLSIVEFLDWLVQGKGQIGIKVTIIEGWTFKQMREALRNAEKLEQVTAEWSDGEIMSALGHPDLHPEGQFYPDTYHYRSGDSDLSIYETAFTLMQKKLDEAWANRSDDLMLENRYEALIMASIIEKETQDVADRPLIAGVFNNRLKIGMKLQTDPTVIYGIGEEYDGDITRKHLRTDTPYNTYTRYGLTPTPISLPGVDSINVAVNPAETDAYYFVAKGEGKHQFSRTLAEHNRAVRKYILKKE